MLKEGDGSRKDRIGLLEDGEYDLVQGEPTKEELCMDTPVWRSLRPNGRVEPQWLSDQVAIVLPLRPRLVSMSDPD